MENDAISTHCFCFLTSYMNNDKATQDGHYPLLGHVMKSKLVAVIALPLVLMLSACGDTWGERAVTGGGMGAGAGLAIGAVAGWPLLAPVLVGTAVGAGIGAATTNNK
jgi:osmotically inducible lipoprotein OsmB